MTSPSARLNIVYPMLFKLSNKKTSRNTHCGVLEFVADEGKIYIPYWMMQNLMLETGGLVTVESATLPVATYSKFQPLSKDFLDLTNPKVCSCSLPSLNLHPTQAVLEMRLRHFACLSKGDIVAISYNNKVTQLLLTRSTFCTHLLDSIRRCTFIKSCTFKLAWSSINDPVPNVQRVYLPTHCPRSTS